MQYADVALSIKTATRQEAFTYAIPPALLADIKVGQRVSVPFYRRELIGVIVALRTTPPKIKGSLKEIKSLVEPFSLFNAADIAFAQKIADPYGATIGQTLELMAPKPAKRLAKKLEVTKSDAADNEQGRSFGLYQNRLDRYQSYVTPIKNAIANHKACQILFPTQELAAQFAATLREQGIEALLLPPPQELTAHYDAWIQAATGQTKVVIGTRKSIFITIPQLRLIIVDAPSEYGYKEEQFPYYNAVSVAKLKADHYGSHLILGDAAPRLEEWHQKISLLPSKNQLPEITVIDTTITRGFLPEVLMERVNEVIIRQGKVAFFYNRRGTGRFYHCLDCETAVYCPRCDNLLTVYEENETTILRCSHCSYETKPTYRCPVCNSYRMGSVGFGIESFAALVRERFPSAKIAVLENDAPLIADYDILIATAQLFYLPIEQPFDLVVCPRADQLLHGTNWNVREEAYLSLSHLAELGRQLVIQTGQPEHLALQALITQDPAILYEEELAHRQRDHYPPVGPLIRLLASDSNEPKLKKAAETLYDKLKPIVPNGLYAIFPPAPIGTGKKRGKYRYQIILKTALTKQLTRAIPSDWQIDPEPADLS